ncbi:MAG: insulinase family protein [Armatimonadetes bacterium]|nr:insulinase family protein [Armatimonadota bacterium]
MYRRAVSRFLPVLGGILAALIAAGPAPAVTLDARSIHERVFPSGLRLIVRPSHALSLTAVQVWIHVGSFRETPETSGYAHIIEHLVFKGGADRAPGILDQEVEDMGGLLAATTGRDWTMFGATVASRYTGRVIHLMGNALRGARFRLEDYGPERGVLLDEIRRAAADPLSVVTQKLYEAAFERHPYRLDTHGLVRTIHTLNLDALRTWYERYYHPANMSVVVVGDVDPETIARLVQAAFEAGGAARAAPEPLPEPELAGAQAKRQEEVTPFAGSYIGLAFPAPSVADVPDVYAMDLLVTLLEQGDYGRLPAALQGHVSGVKATFETRRQQGLLTVVARTDAGNAALVEEALRREIRRLGAEGVSNADLATTKRVLVGTYALDNETFSGQANTLGYYEAIDNWRFATTYLEKIQAVSADEVKATARKYLSLDRCCTVVLRPRAVPSGESPAPAVGNLLHLLREGSQ